VEKKWKKSGKKVEKMKKVKTGESISVFSSEHFQKKLGISNQPYK